MSLFRNIVRFSFSVKRSPSAEFRICNIQLRIADKNRRRVELSSSVLLQTLGKLKSLQGTELSVVVVICLLGSFWILTLNSRCWLIVINEVKRYEVWLHIRCLLRYDMYSCKLIFIRLSWIYLLPINLTLSPIIFISIITSIIFWCPRSAKTM